LWQTIFLFTLCSNPFHLKLPLLLSQYLREQKTLSLPGIGIFHFTGPISINEEPTESLSAHISFENRKVKEPEDGLISFIKQQTGKIKPLALADLDCFIASGLELLSMGKPFHLDGIGIIQKKKDGQYEFSQREFPDSRMENGGQAKKASVFEEGKYEPKSNPLQRILAVGLLLAGLAIVLLGGYYLYNKSNNANASGGEENLNDAPVLQPLVDSSAKKQDSSLIVKQPVAYKFVLEKTDNKKRALHRYNQLKALSINVNIETPDSANFKLFLLVPGSTAADTSRIKDSLNSYYGRRVTIEQ